MKQLSSMEILQIKKYYAERWQDPINRIEDIFNIRRSDGKLIPYKVPEPQKKLIRDGILGKSRELVNSGISYIGVTNKGRQEGFSAIAAAESVLIAEDFPGTFIFYVATSVEQAFDWMKKLNQLIEDSNSWPQEMGGGKMLNISSIKKVSDKVVNGTHIVGLAANPSSIRGKTGIAVIFDEAAWAIRFKNQARETWKALKYIIRQGGQARIQSTPRTGDSEEFFWGFYTRGETGKTAVHSYYCPVIENWQELDLNEPLWIDLDNSRRQLKGIDELKDGEEQMLIERYSKLEIFEVIPGTHIKQKAIIPYPWINIEDLETDRADDLDQFKQENLGVPLDETYKLIKTEWIYSNLNEDAEYDSRGESQNSFYITCDFAQKNDITAITVTEAIMNAETGQSTFIERKIIESQAKYTEQRDIIFDAFIQFRPRRIIFDNNAHGIVIGDMLEEALMINGFDKKILMRVNFTTPNKEIMAQGFRNLVQPNESTGKSRYRWLYKEKHHRMAIKHCTRVEKQNLSTGSRYSGKMYGRDDHFWSKALIAFVVKNTSGVIKAAFGKTTKLPKDEEFLTYGGKFINGLKQDRYKTQEEIQIEREEDAIKKEAINKNKRLKIARDYLMNRKLFCISQKKVVKAIECGNPELCNNIKCQSRAYVFDICKRHQLEVEEVCKDYA